MCVGGLHPEAPPSPNMNLLSYLLLRSHNKINVRFLRCNGACVSPSPNPGKQEMKS